MLIRHKNTHSNASPDARLHTLTGADGAVHARQLVFALHVGSHLDPGIRRKHRPVERVGK